MIKINKDFNDVPASLNSDKTNNARNKCIEAEKYIDSTYYKCNDVKEKLKEIYNSKCVYCEKDISDSFQHIEHFRPKSIYYWLAFSWDNLLLCCDRCNNYKRLHFEIKETRASFHTNDLDNIHNLHKKYNTLEKQMMINPEIEDIEKDLIFERSGKIRSDNERLQHTIEKCQVDRDEANEKRKRILDQLLNKINDRTYSEKHDEITGLINDFITENKDSKTEYLAFRRWVVCNLADLLKKNL